jgi:1,4-alpha-glucan branching enzyme
VQQLGAFTFVLHSHLPYCRQAGRWPHGEEWLHEAAAETYLPLLNALYDLAEDGVPARLTLGITPILTEQLADPLVREHFVLYLEEKIAAAEADLPRFEREKKRHLAYLAGFYRDGYTQTLVSFRDRFQGDLIGAFARLQQAGMIEIVTCAATHGYLPLLSRDSSIYGQLRTGIESYRRHYGAAPTAIWLPECAYRPAYYDEGGQLRPALEEFLSAQGIGCFFSETHTIEGGRPVGKAAGEAIGPYGAIRRQYVVPMDENQQTSGTTYHAYYVAGSAQGLTDPPVAVIGRNNRTGMQVWSADWGYPGDGDYREFHKKDPMSGMQYWRVTGAQTDLGHKDAYHPDWAAYKVGAHAEHFVSLIEDQLRAHYDQEGRLGLIAANYDTELFGHWWFEGVEWIKQVLARLAASETVQLTTASAYVEAHPPQEAIALPESSWGTGGTHWTWNNPNTQWMWPPIHQAEERMEALTAAHPEPRGAFEGALNQAARELLLLQSSDWPFLVTTGQARAYAIERFQSHVDRFNELADQIEAGQAGEARALAEALWERDKVFPTLDHRWFAARQGKADG